MAHSNEKIKPIEKIMDETWSKRANENAKKYIALSNWETEDEFDRSGSLNADRILKELHKYNIHNMRGLEIGCGIGRITKYMSSHFKEIAIVDVSSEMIYFAKKRLANIKNVSIYHTDGIRLPFPENNFDVVYSALVFQHMPRNVFLENLSEINNVLKDNGVFIFQIYEKKKICHLLYMHWLRNLRNLHLKFWIDPPDEDTWVARAYSRKELKEFLMSSGFGKIKFENLSDREGDLWITCVKNTII